MNKYLRRSKLKPAWYATCDCRPPCRQHGHQPIKMPKLQLWEESCGEAHAISHENRDYPNQRSRTWYVTNNRIHTSTDEPHILFQTVVFTDPVAPKIYGWAVFLTYNSADRQCMCWSFTAVTFEYGIFLRDSPTWLSSLLQRQLLGWCRRGHCLQTL